MMKTNSPGVPPQLLELLKNMEPAERRDYCRKAVAGYMRVIASMIETGSIDAFDLAWSHDAELLKPLGRLVFDPQYITTPLPAPPAPEPSPEAVELAQAQGMDPARAQAVLDHLAATKPRAPTKLSDIQGEIPVDDISKFTENARKCEDPNCPTCARKS
jgi:hypothetical protein